MIRKERETTNRVEPVQRSFATMLSWLVRIGLGLLFVAFVLYAAGVVPSTVALDDVPSLWHLDAAAFTEETGREPGWSWLRSLNEGRTLVFAALVVFPFGAMALVAATVALYLRQKTPIYALLAGLEAIVLVVAATGLLAAGH